MRAEKETTILPLIHISIVSAVYNSFTFAIMLCRAGKFGEFSNLDSISAHLSVLSSEWQLCGPHATLFLLSCLGWTVSGIQAEPSLVHSLQYR